MKFLKLFPVIVFLILNLSLVYGSVSVTTACTADKTIIKISDKADAHASKWDYAAYSYYVCNSESITGDSHSCTGDNLVIKLSSESDGHASAPDSNSNDPINICYNNLSCVSKSSCNSDEVCVVKLSDSADSHVYECSNTAALSVCCKSEVQPPAPQQEQTPQQQTPQGDGGSGNGGGGNGGSDGEGDSETGGVRQLEDCTDGKDNDGDGNADCDDSKCRSHQVCAESPEGEPQLGGIDAPQFGSSEEGTLSEDIPVETEEEKSNLILYVVIGIILLLIIAGLLIYFFKFRKKKEEVIQPQNQM